MFRNAVELHQEAKWPGVSGGSRQRLMEELQSEYHSLHSVYRYGPAVDSSDSTAFCCTVSPISLNNTDDVLSCLSVLV